MSTKKYLDLDGLSKLWGNIDTKFASKDYVATNSSKKISSIQSVYGVSSSASTKPDRWTLPSEYQEKTYLQSSGEELIDTGVDASQVRKIECRFAPKNATSSQYITGGRQTSPSKIIFAIDGSTSSTKFSGIYNGTTVTTVDIDRANNTIVDTSLEISAVSNGKRTMTFKVNNGTYDETITQNDVDDYTTTGYTVGVFGWNSNNKTSCRIYREKIYTDEGLVRDYVPVLNKTTNKYGLYDMVNNEFYTDGNNTFSTYGSNTTFNPQLTSDEQYMWQRTIIQYADGTKQISDNRVQRSEIVSSITKSSTDQQIGSAKAAYGITHLAGTVDNPVILYNLNAGAYTLEGNFKFYSTGTIQATYARYRTAIVIYGGSSANYVLLGSSLTTGRIMKVYKVESTQATLLGDVMLDTDVLTLTNTTAFTPTADYHPATKKYVDDTVSDCIQEPSSEGTSGQVLTTDGAGGRTWTTVSGGGGTSDYTDLTNKPQINGTTLTGNKSLSDLGIASKTEYGDSTINIGRASDTTIGTNSVALGQSNIASGRDACAIGISNIASAAETLALGQECTASDETAIAGGIGSTASGFVSLAYGDTATASGDSAIALGEHTLASSDNQTALGKYNIEDSNDTYAEIVGNGAYVSGTGIVRNNARTTDWSGNGWYAGNIKVGGTSYSDSNAKELATKDYIDSLVSEGATKTILYNGKANNTAILNDVTQELPESIHNFDLIIVATNAQITPTLRSMEVTQVIYPKTDLITYCDATGTGANGVWQVFNCNTNYTSSGNAYRVMFGFTDATHIRNVLGTPVNSWTNPGICYVVGYKFKAVVLPGGNNVYDVMSISDSSNWESATIEPSFQKLKTSATTIKAQLDEIKTTLMNGRNVSFEKKTVNSGGELHTFLQHRWAISGGGGVSMFVVEPDITDDTKNYTYILEAPAGYEEVTGVWLKDLQL